MKAMVINEFSSESQFESCEVSNPVIKSGHVIIKVLASSVNPVDTLLKTSGDQFPFGPNLPAILGMDVAGIITELANDVTDFKVGDEVYGCAGGLADLDGSLAQFMLADANLIALKPKNISMREAAALPLVGITAFEGLTRAGIKEGQKVLIHGGAGGVGHVALQLAKHFKADVYATGSKEKIALIENLGAKAINYQHSTVEQYVNECTQGEGFDLIFDTIGGQNLLQSFQAASLNAQIATTVSLLELDLSLAHLKGLSLHVVFMLIPMIHNKKRAEHGQILKTLCKLVEANELKPVLDDSNFTFEQAGEAYEKLTSGKAVGKIVLSYE